MVVVSEELQRRALERAFELEFDLVAHLDGGEIAFKPLASHPRPLGVGAPIAAQVRKLIRASCDADAAAAAAEGIVCGPASDEAAGDEAAGEAAPAPRRSASETMSLEGTPPSWSEDDESASLSPFSRAATFEAELCETSEARPGHAPPPPAAALKPASPASKPAAAAKRDHDLANGGAAPSGEEAAKQLAVPGDGSFEIRHSGRSMRAARPRVGSAVASGEASAHPPAA